MASLQSAPKVDEAEMAIVKDARALIKAPALRSHWLYVPSMIALFTGMRLGEIACGAAMPSRVERAERARARLALDAADVLE